MKFPLRVRWVVAGAVASGAVILAVSLRSVLLGPAPGAASLAFALALGAGIVGSWNWPLIIYFPKESQTAHLDEAAFVALVLLVRPDMAVLTFSLAVVIAQSVRRPAWAKWAFNCGQACTAAGAGALGFHLLAGKLSATAVSDRALGAALVSGAVYMAVNSIAMASVLTATGRLEWPEALLGGLEVRAPLSLGGMVIVLPGAVMVHGHPWLLPLAAAPLVVLRMLLAGHSHVRHDRARVQGLFQAALDANRSMGHQEVVDAIVSAARHLLRCSDVTLEAAPGGDDCLQSPVSISGSVRWLTVRGRSRTEPFDGADQSLLDALAAVGAGALANAELYQEIHGQERQLSAITSSLGEGVCAVSRSGTMTFINPAARAMLGWPDRHQDHDEGNGASDRRAPDFVVAAARRCMVTMLTITNDGTRFQRADGSYFDVAFTASPVVEDGSPTGAVIVFRDITERKRFEEQLARHAFHDPLTGLPNRRLFLDHLDHAMLRSGRSDEQHAVLFADVDRFKQINDSLGHQAGDELLVAIAERMREALRPGDMLARIGGDEFTILLEGVNGVDDAVTVARRVLDRMRWPVCLDDGHEVVSSVSIGIALTAPGKTRDDILHDADVAMYESKGKGRGGQYQVFDVEAMGERSAERIELEAGLRRALDRSELQVFFQPLYSIDQRSIVGVEALARWDHPEKGLLQAGHFIPLAEESGLILTLGRQVLEEACRQAKRWLEQFGRRIVVSVNLSARQFQHAYLLEEIKGVLRSTGVDPSQLSLEITESLAIENVRRTRETLCKLKELGIRVAIDDFGTGHSALGYLTQFPVDVVKIDRSFVEEIEVDPVKSAIVSSVIRLSQAIGTTTVVEGVETEEQLDHLRALGCREAQGFFLAPPMPARELDDALRSEIEGRSEMAAVG